MDDKKWYTSKTIISNVLIGAIGVLGVLQGNELAANPKVQQGFATTVMIVNIILRLITNKPISK